MPNSFYITTPIYYVNGKPHIGHAYTTTAADAAARFQRAKGKQVFFQTGTDEHGQKVLEKARERGMEPMAHCDDMVVHWKEMMERLQISYDRFMRTTDPEHMKAVQGVLQMLHDRDLLYKQGYVGWYSPSAERFWTEKDLIDGKCPDTGQPVQKVEETNWFFKMSQYQQRLVDHIEANPGFIQPESRKNEVLGFLRQELGDLCISRPKARMSWGIEFPFDEDYVTYVWFDALLNYLTGIGYRPDGSTQHEAFWPADFQLIGKDILTTHAVYWTTMLMAMEVPLPKCIYAHGWWMSHDGRKMSKSLGNVIDVELLRRNFGLDATRYFLLREIAFGADGHFSYDGFLGRYNTDLANDLGNMAHRGLSMTSNWLGGTVPAYGASTGHEEALVALAGEKLKEFDAQMEGLQFHKALDAIMDVVRATNKYIDTTEPWALNKAGNVDALNTVMRTVLEVSYFATMALECVIPNKAAELFGKVGKTTEQARADLVAALHVGVDFQALEEGAAVEVGDPLFPRFRKQPEEIAELLEAAKAAEAAAKPAKKSKKKKKSKVKEPITFEDFSKLDLRVGEVLSGEKHPDADKLLVLKVSLGEEQPRQIVAGIASKFSVDDLVGRKVVVVANLAPATIRGVESQGMIMAAGGKEVVDLVAVDANVGEVVR